MTLVPFCVDEDATLKEIHGEDEDQSLIPLVRRGLRHPRQRVEALSWVESQLKGKESRGCGGYGHSQ